MKLRHPLAALAAAALALAALTGCQSNVGTAAHVDGTSIRTSTVDDLLRTLSTEEVEALSAKSAGPVTASSAARGARTVVVTFSVRDAQFEKVWDARGGQPPTEVIEGLHDRALQYLFNVPSVPGGAEGDAVLRAQLEEIGVDPSYGPTMLHSTALLLALADKTGATGDAAVLAAVDEINEAGVQVRVNPRFGTWDPSSLSVGATELPSFLRIPGSLAATA